MNNGEFFLPFIPISLFVCITYAVKAIVDARVRKQLVSANVSQDLVRSIIEGDEIRRRHASLRWGIILVSLSACFAIIQQSYWHELTPGMIAVLAGATGLGNLVYFAIARKLS